MPPITLTTDFGPAGRYVAQMKGVLLSLCPEAKLVDLSHEIPPQDIGAGAKLLREAAPYYREGTVHLAVIDPGVGTERAIVAIDALGQRFIGPDNGLFGWLKNESPQMVTLDPAKIGVTASSNTFHGRDLMAPAAARLATGAALLELGSETDSLVLLMEAPQPVFGEKRIEGCVVEVDHYGNLITNVPGDALNDAPHGDALRIRCDEHFTLGLQQTYGDHPPQTLIALVGSGGMVELAIVNGDAAAMLRAKQGDAVYLSWEPTN